ncbi:hypothetical protein ACFXI6_14260 [Streptomyces mirabilis]|uniref:hypothetical protein n=1 Tax=Streptomyces mirabilis TaxID=68239 RepID=UPI0036CC3FAA
MTDATITTADPLQRGAMVALDGESLLRVVSTTGTGPYTSVVRRIPKWRIRLSHAWRRLVGPWRRWRESRCEPFDDRDAWCWRRETYNGRCDRHALIAVERGEDL